jgi:hypothetical protein
MLLVVGGKVQVGEIPMPSTQDVVNTLRGRTERIILKSAEYWPFRTEAPIAAGGAVGGWLMAVFPDASTDDVNRGVELIVECQDAIDGHTHSVKQQLKKSGVNRLPGVF